jgi:aminoglycoside phosphotransferase (APT) family kinase protein
VVAVRQSQPGRLQIALARVAELLATLHSRSADPAAEPDFERAARDGLEYAHELGEYGVVKGEPAILAGLQTAIDRWRSLSVMSAFTPCLVHGDATTTNFVLTQEGGVVAIDWERLKIADPAFDLGRLAAEVAHSAEGAGGSGEEIDALTQELIGHYRDHSPGSEADPGLLERARFYQAISMLRIARNGWVPRLARMTLVARAMALLNE